MVLPPRGLNPYCTGICSRTHFQNRECKALEFVLILIVLEFALARDRAYSFTPWPASLNPYCTGICSRTYIFKIENVRPSNVLILIVLEFALAHH